MKLAIVLCAVLGLSFGAVLPHGNQHPLVHHHDARNLNDLFQELMKLIPKDKIVEIALTHLENDPEVQEAVAYLRSDDFEKIVTTVQNMQEFKDFLKYLSDSGLDIYTYINFINDLLGLPHVNPTRHRRSIMSMIDEILAVIPVEEIKKFYHEKIENDPDFIHLVERLRSPEFRKIVDAVRSMPEYTDLLERLRSHGIDVDAIQKKINDFFGWGRKAFRSTRDLNDLYNEFMKLIPKDKIIEIALNHLENDPEVQEAVAYLRSDDFKKIVTTVQSMQEFKDFLKYVYDSGFDIYTYINNINDLLGLPHVNPRHKRSIMSMIDEILAVLPIDEIKKFYHERVENDPDFIALMERLSSPEFIKIVEAVRNMPEFTDLQERLRSHGIDVDAIQKKINDFFGWGRKAFRSTRDLNDLYNEFMKLIPKDKIIEIALNHLENDPEVQEAVAYLRSDDFKKIVTTVQSMQEFKDFLKYVYDSGFDIYTYINNINDLLGLPHVNPRHKRSIMSMIDEILAVLPIDEIKKFYHERVENDPDFIALMERLSSPEFIKIVEAVRNMPEFTDLQERLRSHGIDVDAIQKKINDFFGWGF